MLVNCLQLEIIYYICREDSVANDYRFFACGGWPLVSRPYFYRVGVYFKTHINNRPKKRPVFELVISFADACRVF